MKQKPIIVAIAKKILIIMMALRTTIQFSSTTALEQRGSTTHQSNAYTHF